MQTSAAGAPDSPDEAAAPTDDQAATGAGDASTRSRWRRPRRYLLLGGAALAVIALGGALAVYLIANSKLNGVRSIKDPFGSIPAAQRPPVPSGALKQDVTFLVGGVDTRSAV